MRSLLGGNHVAVGAARHQAILHFAARGQFVRQPQPHRQQDDGNRQSRNRGAPASTLVGVGHRLVIPVKQPLPPIASPRLADTATIKPSPLSRSRHRLAGFGALMEPMTPDSVKWFDVWIEFQPFRFADLRIVTGARRSYELYRG